ncbi:von Willebrand factor A domain-containing protein 3B isoform X6 [Rousettus aegyptiacus]|uniref:von Willebrand factor A domain-containing protein 3B isoform X6 n=1 Tax=Rousettus aegyptiacus TaxID=9407 RepID=UPI00168D21AD|nr:von Willebrand factor A domain-containing protein 3B isoform X6 [Rousettus aegyptiacus]
MQVSGSSSIISEQQLWKQEGLRNTKTDMAKQSLISSEAWLQLHGLKSNKLTLKQILSRIGFPHCEDYVASLGRLVASRYAEGLFPRVYRAEDGTAYNLTARSELIYQFVEHLTQAVESYKERMDWLTSESRQIFGVILEQHITIVLDLGGMQEEELRLCQDALVMVLREQVAHIAKFNIIRASQVPVKWQDNAAPVTEQSIAAAISWIENLTFEHALSQASHLDALLEAGKDKTIDSIYYFVVGDISEEAKQLLVQRTLEIPCPVCTVSFNARGEGTVTFLKDLSAKARGRFHAFAERTECVEFPEFPRRDGDSTMTWNSRKLKGKPPPGAGVREDVFLIWREMEEACRTLAQIQRVLATLPKFGMTTTEHESGATSIQNESNLEDTWDSKKWLQKYGLKAQKLSFYDVLAECSFRHADGVVDIKTKPENESMQTSAETNKKTVHAKYCSRFIHAPWKDGSLVHVCITKETCTWYSERIHAVLAQIQRRIKWLQDGSQILFGKVRNDCIYVLIDTSHSMKDKLVFVKDKIIQFIQEQLKYKRKFNFVQFDAQAVAWQEKLVEIDEDNLKGAQSWLRDIKIGSSTNTLNALQLAFADKETQAIYLLTDGRPDQSEDLTLLIKEMEQGSSDLEKVFPLAHVCSDTNKMTLINPQGVKLNIYKQKVEQAIKSYEKRLNKIVWRALSQEEKEKLDANKPMRYLENKAALNKALERLNWPISLKELSMLENEILAGKMYVQQAMELQEAAKKENYMSRALGEQEKFQGNPTKKTKSKKLDYLKGQKVIARCDENGFYFPGVVKKCVSPTHALVGFRYGDTKVVPISFITPVGGAMPCPLLQVGDYVFAKIVTPNGFDFYVPAIVIALPNHDVAEDKFYTVLKCNNRREFCPRSALIKISQNKYALSCSHIKSPPVQEDPKVVDVDKNSALLTWPIKGADTADLQELRQENPRRKKKKSAKRLPLHEVVSSDSDDPSHDNRSQDSYPKRHPMPRVGGE